MSGICGLYNLDGAPVQAAELARMTAPLERRGPDRTGAWHAGPIGLGHTLLATTPEAVFERLPLTHAESGCVITADARLDNRPELLRALDHSERAATLGDAEIILLAYLRWGEACVERFLGDFAFAIWHPRQQTLFCARDHFGVRPLYIHHTAGRFFVFASEPRAILALPQVPYRINEGRIADFLVEDLEGIDFTSTFFEEVYRLEPAHSLTVTPQGVQKRRYWSLEPGEELRLPSDDAYAEAFLEVFTEAVRCRLRSAGPVGSMLSGGMDSSSIVAVARTLLAEEGRGPLYTFSGVSPDGVDCVETRAIHAVLTMDGLAPTMISSGTWGDLLPELERLTWNLNEPVDNHMTLPRLMYLAAHQQGLKVLLDGAAGDVVLGAGTYLARLLRNGHWLTAWREAVEQHRFWGEYHPAGRELYHAVRLAFVPNFARHLRKQVQGKQRDQRRLQQVVEEAIINPDFARQVDLSARLHTLASYGTPGLDSSYSRERARVIAQPFLVAARERYDRVAAAVAVEPRDPFLDLRLVRFCLALPGNQKLGGGWPKIILRRAINGRLPDVVRWRRGKQGLGWPFTLALMDTTQAQLRIAIQENRSIISTYVKVEIVRQACQAYFDNGDRVQARKVYDAAHLALWLRNHRL